MRRSVMAAVAVCSVVSMAVTPTAGAQSVSTGSVSGFWESGRGSVDATSPADDHEFYRSPAGVDLLAAAPGTVLRERTLNYHIASLPTPLRVTQLLYRTADAMGEPAANVTSIIQPPGAPDGNVVSYGSFYDSLNPTDNPSRAIAGNRTVGGLTTAFETALLMPALLAGHRVVMTDTEGPGPDFASGPTYGKSNLDSLRAAEHARSGGISPRDQIGLFGYSGGAIAAGWSAIQMHGYAPELEHQVVGVAEGGVLVDPIHNLGYAGEGFVWSAVTAMALVGLSRSYHIAIDSYLNDKGKAMFQDVAKLSIVEAFGRYPKVRWSEIALPQYPTPEDVPELKRVIASINMGIAPIPTVPMRIFQGGGGELEGTPAQNPGVGRGDGIMVTSDVRALAHRYCAAGTSVQYHEYPQLSHIPTAIPWVVEGTQWLESRFHGAAPTDNCATTPGGNDIG